MKRFVAFLFVITLTACISPAPTDTPQPQVAPPTITEEREPETVTPSPTIEKWKVSGAGRWYPAEADKLAAAVDKYLAEGGENVGAKPLGLLVPHAGYIFSGAVAGRAFAQVAEERYDTVVIIGDTHSGNGKAEIAVYAAGAWETPLGTVLIDEAIAQALVRADERIEFDRAAFKEEHPVENQVPFLQRALTNDFKIVPIVFRNPTAENIARLSEILSEVLAGRDALIVGSTDLSHYPAYEDAVRVDTETLQAIETFEPEEFTAVIAANMNEEIANLSTCACSQGAVLTTMRVSKALGANKAITLFYANSGDTPFGNREQVVGYGAVMFYRETAGDPNIDINSALLTPTPLTTPNQESYTEEEKRLMLGIARDSIEQFLEINTLPTYVITNPALLRQNGAFVTLKRKAVPANAALRGCIGHIIGRTPLYLTIQNVAVSAAVNDRRFAPVTRDELDELEVEISVLSEPRLITDTNEIQVGTHGIILVQGNNQGVFLPQVPLEQGWDRAEYLREICGKAGLEMTDGCWKNGQIYVFTAKVFNESEIESAD